MDERLKFVAQLLDGDFGLAGLSDRARRPYRQANELPFQVESRIVQLKRERPSWDEMNTAPFKECASPK